MSSFAATASLKVSPRRLFNSSTAARAIRYFASGSSSRMVDYRSSLFQLGNTSPDYQHRHGLQQLRNSRHYSPTSLICDSSPFSDNNNSDSQTLTRKKRKKKRFIPRKAAVQLTPKAREFFKKLLESDPTKKGILLDYHQASSGEPRMVFSFKFVNNTDDDDGGDGGTLTDDDEGYGGVIAIVNYYDTDVLIDL